MSSFRQCQATKANGERCQRKAQGGSSFCHSHRQWAPPDMKGLISYPDVGIHLSEKFSISTCKDCGDLVFDAPLMWWIASGEGELGEFVILCRPCFNKRQNIVELIFEMIEKSGTPIKQMDFFKRMQDDYDISGEIVKDIIDSLLKSGRLVLSHQ